MDYRGLFTSLIRFEEEATMEELGREMDQGNITSVQLVQMYLDRIARFNQQGPEINAILEINPDALHIAEALDVERKQKGSRGPLHGIPVLLKDNLDTGDSMHTSAGTLALANSYAKEDSFVAAQLRKAGAVLLGKANMTEWANFMTENMPNGFSSRGGQVRNPYGAGTFDVGGSSSGSAAAIAANFAVAAIGTETSGSILSPASQNSLVGIKPTVGHVSRTGIIPIASSQDTAGPIARTVTDAALLLGAITGVDERDPATLSQAGYVLSDYRPELQKDGLRGARIGVPRAYYERMDENRLKLVEKAMETMRTLGAEIIDPVDLDNPKDLWNYDVLLYEFKACLNAYLSKLDSKASVHTLADVIVFNRDCADKALKYGQIIMEKSNETSGTLTDAEYLQARLKDLYYSRQVGIDRVMDEWKLDALLFVNNYGAGIAAKAGYPSITVPAGYTDDGEPVGITYTGKEYSEARLINLAYSYEQATLHRKAPKF